MARAKDLAALAGLAGLAYAMRKKDSDTSTTDTGDETERLKARKPAPEQSAGDKAVSDTKSSVLTALQKPKNIREEGIAAANDVSTAPTALAPKAPVTVKRAADNTAASKYPSGVMAGTRGASASKMYPSGVMGGAKQADATSSTPAASKSTTSSSAEGMKNYAPRRTPTTDFTPGKVPSSAQAAANRQAVVDKTKAAVSGVSDYISNFETPAERRYREAKEASTRSGMKRGGTVKKMASGGMTASKRADGIASKGKTKCKMY